MARLYNRLAFYFRLFFIKRFCEHRDDGQISLFNDKFLRLLLVFTLEEGKCTPLRDNRFYKLNVILSVNVYQPVNDELLRLSVNVAALDVLNRYC